MSDHTSTPVRWGVISTANIGRKSVIPAIQGSRNGKVVAVASRDEARARKFADELGIERAYGSYEALIADPNIDAIYNPLPNDGHVPWSMAAAQAKKPTLVEKPMGVNADDAQKLVDCFRSENVLLAEAFMYRYHPQHAKIRQLLAESGIGPLKMITSAFTFSMAQNVTQNVRLKPELGGGGLLDVGCYCVNAIRWFAGEEPDSVSGYAQIGATGVDECFVGILHFPSGLLAHFDSGIRSMFRSTYTLICQQGMITSDKTFNVPADHSPTIRVTNNADKVETYTIPAVNQYRLMVEDFADAVQQGRKMTYDPAESIKNMRVLDALARSAREGVTVRL